MDPFEAQRTARQYRLVNRGNPATDRVRRPERFQRLSRPRFWGARRAAGLDRGRLVGGRTRVAAIGHRFGGRVRSPPSDSGKVQQRSGPRARLPPAAAGSACPEHWSKAISAAFGRSLLRFGWPDVLLVCLLDNVNETNRTRCGISLRVARALGLAMLGDVT